MNKKMKDEAVSRMEILGLFYNAIEAFKNEDKVHISKPVFGNRAAALYNCTKAEQELVKKVENEYGILVYHAIRNNTEDGIMYTMLYVSGEEEEWEDDRRDINVIHDGIVPAPVAYVWNAGNVKEDAKDITDGFGEFGSVQVVPGSGGLCRIG